MQTNPKSSQPILQTRKLKNRKLSTRSKSPCSSGANPYFKPSLKNLSHSPPRAGHCSAIPTPSGHHYLCLCTRLPDLIKPPPLQYSSQERLLGSRTSSPPILVAVSGQRHPPFLTMIPSSCAGRDRSLPRNLLKLQISSESHSAVPAAPPTGSPWTSAGCACPSALNPSRPGSALSQSTFPARCLVGVATVPHGDLHLNSRAGVGYLQG